MVLHAFRSRASSGELIPLGNLLSIREKADAGRLQRYNQLRDKGVAFNEAILEGAGKRLRPILMTAFTTVIGAVPLILSISPGHEARTVIGVVVMCGVGVATLITLFLVPLAYALFGRDTASPGTVGRQLRYELSQYELSQNN